MLLTENALTEHDVMRVTHLHDPEEVAVRVLVPEHPDAQAHVTTSVQALQAAGVAASGAVVAADPLDAVATAVRESNADEVVVVTEPHLVADGLHRDWASRIRRDLDLPVLHVMAGSDQIIS